MKKHLEKRIFYIIEMETDGWAWWSTWRNVWTKVPYSATSCEKKWVGKEQFLKAGYTYSWNVRKNQFKRMSHNIINEMYISDYLPVETVVDIEDKFENVFKDQYHHEPIKRWSGCWECYTLDLKSNFSSVETFIKEHIG